MGGGGASMESELWWDIESKLKRVEADGGEVLRRSRGVLSWKTPEELDYESGMDPKIALLRSRYANPDEWASLNATYFAPGMPMRALGHIARHVEG